MIENRFLDYLASTYIAPQSEAVEPVMAPGQQPGDILVAEVGSRGLPESVYSGEPPRAEMKPYDPSLIERAAHNVQMWLEGLGVDRYKARQNAQSLIGGASSNLPFGIGFLDALGSLPKIGVPVGMAMSPFYVDQAQRLGKESLTAAEQGRYGAAAMEAGLGALSLIPGVQAGMYVAKEGAKGIAKGAEYLGPKAAEMAQQGIEKVMAPMMPRIVEPGPSMGDAAKAAAPVSDIGFYSAVEKAASGLQRKSGTGQSFLNDITKGENVKADEIKWMGLDDFLKGKKNVTREEVQDFIRNNRVDVQEVQLGNEPTRWEGNTLLVDNKPVGEIKDSAGGYVWMKPDGTSTQLQSNRMFDAVDEVMKLTGVETRPQTRDTMPKFAKYTLPGGENYREILLTLPSNRPSIKNMTRAEYNAAIDAADRAGVQDFRSGHWDQPNVLAHIRVNDRVDADGKKMLLVEEVQSDWHQAGRDKGYAPKDISSVKMEAIVNNSADQPYYEVRTTDGRFVANILDVPVQAGNEARAVTEAERFLRNRGIPGSVPDAPMKDTWYQLALKRVLKYAADNGYERVGLTTGSRQAERYDLSKQVDSLLYSKNDDGTYKVSAQIQGRGQMLGESIPEAKLADYVGKEVAEKMAKGTGNRTEVAGNYDPVSMTQGPRKYMTELSGDGLKVGGEGMKKYYDEIYPKFLDKYGKKWGAKVGETTINLQKDLEGFMPRKDMQIESVRYIDITPEMKASTSEGQPLFTATGVGAGTAGATMDDRKQQGRGAE